MLVCPRRGCDDSVVTLNLSVRATTDAAAYGARIAPLIAADPVLTSVVATNLRRELSHPGTFGGACWMWVEDMGGTVVAAAMHTPPWRPHLASEDPQVGIAVADFIGGAGRLINGVGARRAAAEAFARRWTAGRECHVTVLREEGIYEATQVVLPSDVPGSLRRASVDEAPLLNAWARAFVGETTTTAPDGEDLIPGRIGAGDLWVWQDEDRAVSMAYASPAEGGVSRISWVYTPPDDRRRGYASAVVAGATIAQLDAGARCMLYTDLSNPTSNGIYQAIGYTRVGDGVTLDFGPQSAT